MTVAPKKNQPSEKKTETPTKPKPKIEETPMIVRKGIVE